MPGTYNELPLTHLFPSNPTINQSIRSAATPFVSALPCIPTLPPSPWCHHLPPSWLVSLTLLFCGGWGGKVGITGGQHRGVWGMVSSISTDQWVHNRKWEPSLQGVQRGLREGLEFYTKKFNYLVLKGETLLTFEKKGPSCTYTNSFLWLRVGWPGRQQDGEMAKCWIQVHCNRQGHESLSQGSSDGMEMKGGRREDIFFQFAFIFLLPVQKPLEAALFIIISSSSSCASLCYLIPFCLASLISQLMVNPLEAWTAPCISIYLQCLPQHR